MTSTPPHSEQQSAIDPREQIALDRYLRPFEAETGEPMISCFNAALRDARYATGRNLDSGLLESPDQPALWLGALGYLALLDQIGSAVRRTEWTNTSGHKIELALAQFAPEVARDERGAIYALRCAFAHDYGLINANSKSGYQHCFYLRDGPGPLVKLPERPSTGPIDGGDHLPTVVHLRTLGDTVESVAEAVREAHATGYLRPAIPPVELERRYLFQIYDEAAELRQLRPSDDSSPPIL